ncbi:hypothetical protein SteCoe_30690 [Stentor coeruleus]|uniref:RRM domain-containing protein n=1 Tax=Stentor coeruleus TaxID=5963 RepID=A0A1R2B343_9CILI|nr:hypothetical protein SteCoe_30690 [Stentor coeruleus]
MEGQKKANWADDSEEEPSEQEEKVVHQPKPLVSTQDWKKEQLLDRINKSSFPLILYLNNLSYTVDAENLANEIGLSSQSKIDLVMNGDKCTGFAAAKVFDIEDAMKLAEKNGQSVCGRTLFVETGQKGGGGKRGDRRGGRRGGRRENYEDRGGRRQDYEDRGGYERKNERKYEKKPEVRPKISEFRSGKITIAQGEDSPTKEPVQAKPKSNPFGNAKPVDTLNKDLEFEKKLEEGKKLQENEEKTQKPKEYDVENTENLVEKEIESPGQEEGNSPTTRYNRGNTRRGGRRGDRYRKAYNPDQRDENKRAETGNEPYNWGESAGNEEGKKESSPEKTQDESPQNESHKRNYQDNRRDKNYNEGRKYYEKKNYDNRKDERNDEENSSGQYVSKFNNKNKPNNRVKAWGDAEEAANVLRKPKDAEEIKIMAGGKNSTG